MKTQEIKEKNILLLGYGRENQSVHRFLLANYPDVSISIADKKEIKPVAPVATIQNRTEYLNNFKTFTTIIRSPGIPIHTKELVEYKLHGGHITTATNIFFSLCRGITIGVTGTKGKSTTSALIAHILSSCHRESRPAGRGDLAQNRIASLLARNDISDTDVRLVGNIGNPMLDYVDKTTDQTIFVIELSSHQLEDCRYSPHIAVILNVFPEHMDYYQTFDQYITAKTNIVAFQSAKDSVIYDDTNTTATTIALHTRGKKIPITDFQKIKLPKSSLIGNDKNIRAALAAASLLRIPAPLASPARLASLANPANPASPASPASPALRDDPALLALQSFHPLSHRLEFVGEYKKIKFYNDSLATIPEATIHAMESLGEKVTTLITGGFDRGLDYTALGAFLAKRKTLKTLILFPDTGEKIKDALLSASPHRFSLITFHLSLTMKSAVSLAYAHTPPGKICLLSPASASYNLFKDYADRGDQFKTWVKQYSQ